MWKHAIVFIGLLLALLIAGCGGSNSSHTTISGITKEAITSSEVSGKTFYLKDISGTTTFVFNSDNTFSSTFVARTTSTSTSASGTWQITDGNIVLTVGATTQTFSCIQQETALYYWLVFDTSTNTISRLYSDQTQASAYDPTHMGGSVQGTSLTLAAGATVLCGSGSTTGGYADGSGTSAQFNKPMSITFDGTYYYVADYANHIIRRVDSSGTVTTFAGHSTVSGSANGTGTGAYFYHPTGITTDGTNLYVVDYGNHTIRQIVISTQVVTTVAGVASSSGSIDSTKGTTAYFNSPMGITTDGTNLYVADTGNYTIRKIRLSGTHAVSTIAGSTGKSDTVEGTYTSARFVLPTRLTTDGSNLYVVDYKGYGGSTIRKVEIATGKVTTLVGGTKPYPFGHLGGITTDGTNLYAGDGDSDLTTSYIHVVNIASAQITSTITVGTATNITPAYGLITNGSHLYYTSSFYNNISYY